MNYKKLNWQQVLAMLILAVGVIISFKTGYQFGKEKIILIFGYELEYKFSLSSALPTFFISVIGSTFFYSLGRIIELLDIICDKLYSKKD